MDQFVARLGLDQHEQATAWSQLLETAVKRTQPAPTEDWRRQEYKRLGLAYRRALDIDCSTAMFMKAATGSSSAGLVGDVAREVQTNREIADLLTRCKPRDAVEEYIRFYYQQNVPTHASSDIERLFSAGELTPRVAYELTRLRDLHLHTPVIWGSEPMWKVVGEIGVGRRSDFMRSDELRYSARTYQQSEAHSLVLNGAPRKDVQVQFRGEFRAGPRLLVAL